MEYYSVKKSKEVLLHDTTWVNLKNIILCEISKKGQIFYVIKVGKFIKTNFQEEPNTLTLVQCS